MDWGLFLVGLIPLVALLVWMSITNWEISELKKDVRALKGGGDG
jgi:hypothetical protein